MDALKCIKERRSVRRYAAKTIDRKILEEIIDAARLAPSGNNQQPWEFVVVTQKDALKKVAAATDYGRFIANAAACVVVFCAETKYAVEDGAAATQNIMLAAKSFGIGACWVAGDKKAYADSVKKILGVPEGFRLISLIPLGYPAEEPRPHGKRSLKEVLHWERF